MRSLRENTRAVIDLGLILMIGISFAALTVVAYIIFTLKGQLWHTPLATDSAAYNSSYTQAGNITVGFDNAIGLILVAITVFILAIAISALLLLRGQ